MANQVEVAKLVGKMLTAPPAANVGVPKLVMYAFVVPSDAGDTSNKQGHVYSQIIRRD